MDRRSWPWKKKSSDKASVPEGVVADTSVSAEVPATQEEHIKPRYVQISVESYTHLTGLEDHLKSYEEQVQVLDSKIINLTEKLSAAQEEIETKEGLVKQHAKVAEEAISGWEKAETEASTLKTHLEAVMLEKCTADDRGDHLDSALKECMRKIRNLKEEHEQELHDVIFSKTKQFEKLKLELESKMDNLDQQLLKSEDENAALARSLQERSNMLIKISEQKSQAEAEIEHLRESIESCEREIGSLKYELHLAAKELEIRSEEKNMSVRSADVANKQHLEAVKKITKLEAECQRLRGLVRKKLPGPAALAQMKLEVESLGWDYSDNNRRRSSGRTSSPNCPFPDFQLEELQKIQKDNEFLADQLMAMEEDTKMLKEALAKRNMELQDSRDMCANISNKLQILEAKTLHDSKSMLKESNARSLTSTSEDGNEYTPSSAESWSTMLNSELSQCKHSKSESAKHLDLMDDFLEMEKLACSSNDSNDLVTNTIISSYTAYGNARQRDTAETISTENIEEKSSNTVKYPKLEFDEDQPPLVKLLSRISMLYEYISKESEGVTILEEMQIIVNDSLQHISTCCGSKEIQCSYASCDRQICPEDAGMSTVKEISQSQGSKSGLENMQTISQEVSAAIQQIHDFVVSLGKTAEAVQDMSPEDDGLVQKVKEFTDKFNSTLYEKTNVVHFVIDLSDILHKANMLKFNFHAVKGNDVASDGSECIDKIALPEHEGITGDIMGDMYANGCSDSGCDPEVPSSSNSEHFLEVKSTSRLCPMEDFEKIKMEKENVETDLIRCSKDLENAQSQLSDTEGKLFELKSQLDLSQISNSIAETQLKCMVESYRSLERRAEELETELNLLREKTKKLEDELQVEKTKHQDALDRFKDLQDQLQRNSNSSMLDDDHKTKQEKDLAAAAEKLAECQETIFLLGRQLKSFRPQPESVNTSHDIAQRVSSPPKGELNLTLEKMLDLDLTEIKAATSAGTVYRTDSESPMKDVYNALYIPTDSEANSYLRSPINVKHQKHRSTHSLPPAYAAPTSEKQSKSGISRFFTKGKF